MLSSSLDGIHRVGFWVYLHSAGVAVLERLHSEPPGVPCPSLQLSDLLQDVQTVGDKTCSRRRKQHDEPERTHKWLNGNGRT